jgi:hypothetical protein
MTDSTPPAHNVCVHIGLTPYFHMKQQMDIVVNIARGTARLPTPCTCMPLLLEPCSNF